MILELAEDVEATTGNALPEDRSTGLYEGPPGNLISGARVRVETIGNDRVAPGAQYDSQAFTERSQPSGVMHQRRLKSAVVLDTSGIVEEWIGGGGGVEKRLVTSNRSVGIEPHDAHFSCCGENRRNVAGRMHREVNHRPSWRRHVGMHGLAVAL